MTFDKGGVIAAEAHQLEVRSRFSDAAILQHYNSVGVNDRGQPVRDNERGATFHQVVQSFLDEGFRFGIERRGGFVEDQDGWVLQNGAGDGDALAFSGREAVAAFTDRCFVVFRQGHDEVVSVRVFGGIFDFGGVRFGAAISNVVANGVVEEERVLEDRTPLSALS